MTHSKGYRDNRKPRVVTHEPCGISVLQVRLSEASKQHTGWASSTVLLEKQQTPGMGSIRVENDAAHVRAVGSGDYWVHRCPAKVSVCKYCGEHVRVLNQPFAGRAERLAVVDAKPNPGGTIALNEDGHAVHDPEFRILGGRFLWHRRHGAAERKHNHDSIYKLMTQRARYENAE